MAKQNVTIAVVLIVLFILIGILGFAVYAAHHNMNVFFWRRRAVDEEEGGS